MISIDKRKLLSNVFSLSALNAINYMLPIALLPYITRTLGPENFGKHIFTLTALQWLSMIVGYGFDYSATRFVATNRCDQRKLSAVYSTVTCLKLLAFAVLGSMLSLALYAVGASRDLSLLLMGGLGVVLGTALTNNWFFQGVEETKYLVIIAVLSKLLIAALVLSCITSEDSYIYINGLYAIGAVFGGVVSMVIARRRFRVEWIPPDRASFVEHVREGWHMFLSISFMSMYREANIIVLGLTANYTFVAAYAAAEKIIKALQSATAPVAIALYPHFGRQLSSVADRTRGLDSLFRLSKLYSLLLAASALVVFLSSNEIIEIFLGAGYQNSILNVQVMSPAILFGGVSYCLGVLGLMNIGMQRAFSNCVMAAGISSVALCVLLSHYYADLGAAIAMLATEFTLLLLLVFQYKKAGLLKNV